MNANPKFLAATAEVDSAAVAPLPKSRKVYETGSRPDIRVPFREIEQADTPTMFGGEKNPPLTVYDCSGPTPTRTPRSTSAAACPSCAAPGSKSAATPSCWPARPATTARNV